MIVPEFERAFDRARAAGKSYAEMEHELVSYLTGNEETQLFFLSEMIHSHPVTLANLGDPHTCPLDVRTVYVDSYEEALSIYWDESCVIPFIGLYNIHSDTQGLAHFTAKNIRTEDAEFDDSLKKATSANEYLTTITKGLFPGQLDDNKTAIYYDFPRQTTSFKELSSTLIPHQDPNHTVVLMTWCGPGTVIFDPNDFVKSTHLNPTSTHIINTREPITGYVCPPDHVLFMPGSEIHVSWFPSSVSQIPPEQNIRMTSRVFISDDLQMIEDPTNTLITIGDPVENTSPDMQIP